MRENFFAYFKVEHSRNTPFYKTRIVNYHYLCSRFMRRLLFLLGVLAVGLGLTGARAQTPHRMDSTFADSTLRVSVLTCSPGQASYELYGHTAIRVISRQSGWDYVFNYGVFDFNQPHFTWRFVLGECDYMVCPYPFALFRTDYQRRGSSITEQVLNLLPAEALELTRALVVNSQPENCVYRYHIFRSNCTTKARDIIEANIFGHVIYPVRPRRNTFRTILHQFTDGHPWDEVGNDILLGASVDTLITERDEMFSPIYLSWYLDSAMIDRGYRRYDSLVCERRVILEADPVRQQLAAEQEAGFPLSPAVAGWLLVVASLLLGLWEVRRLRALWPVDAVLMALQGIAGLLLMFMAFFSQHPGVGSNWQVWVLNPLALLFVVAVVRADRHSEPCYYHRLSAALLILFIVLSLWLPQDLSSLTIPLALLLLSRAIVHIVIDKRRISH